MRKTLALMAAMAAFFVASQTFVAAQDAPSGEEKRAESKEDGAESPSEAAFKEIDTFLRSRPKNKAEADARPAEMARLLEAHKSVDFGANAFVYIVLQSFAGQQIEAAKSLKAYIDVHGEVSDPAYGRAVAGIFPQAIGASIGAKDWDSARLCLDNGAAPSCVQAALSALKTAEGDDAAKFKTEVMNKLLYSKDIKDEDRLTILKKANAPTWERGFQELKKGETLNITDALDLEGNTINLSDYKGQVVLVDFWATWCGPCIAEMPNVVETFKKYKDRGFTVLAISFDKSKMVDEVDTTVEKVKTFMKEHGMEWPSIYDGKYWENEYGVRNGIRSIPAGFLVDHEGNVRYSGARGEDLPKTVELLVKELEASKAKADK